MELIPKEVKEQIPSLYATENQNNPTVFVKLFLDSWTWYITELSIDGDIAFGYVVSSFGAELGYFSLEEIKGLRTLGIGVERDLEFKPTKLSIIKKAS
ncbi:DUF2958 domain-containing protein [Aliarcobacter butzleri]|uniref:DUF2958 domain-containing protein n=1 Tax=Aliarcobacter butzleri TaxID=28197 RepID=UPI002B247E07|nr:DUF2958 domain-containing protein [Aliarcobacter butzleri]